MNIGHIIYKKVDANINYISWIINEFLKEGITLKLLYEEDFLKHGLNEKTDFIINKTRNVNITYMFEINNIRVFNNSKVSELSSNKLKAYSYAKKNRINSSDILLYKTEENFIKKTVDGHGGNDVQLSNNIFLEDDNWLCQKFAKNTVGDIRFYIVGNKIINACIRKNENSFLHNYKKGASISIYNYSKDEEQLVYKFLNNIYCDYAGVDFLLQSDGHLLFNEIEDVCGSIMLSKLGVNNTTYEFVKHVKHVIYNE